MDILLILVVIIVGIVGGRMLLGGRGAAESGADTKTYSYVVMGEEVVAETANFPVVGGNAYESSTSTYLGTDEGCENRAVYGNDVQPHYGEI